MEKPFTANVAQAEELIELAAKKNLQIMVDHTFLFTGAVRKIRQLVDEGVLGKLYYYDSMRVNLGLFQHDINVIWDLAPHDLSIMDHLIQKKPEAIVATGEKHLNGHEDIAFLTIYFPDNVIAHINVNWLSPVKVRTTLIGGEKKMLVWNDLEADEKIKIYDKGVADEERQQGVYDLLVSYRSGDMWAPRRRADRSAEAAKPDTSWTAFPQTEHPFNDGHAGLRVVRLLEAAEQSLKDRGKRCNCSRLQHRVLKDSHYENSMSTKPGQSAEQFLSSLPTSSWARSQAVEVHQLYGCEIGDDTKIGAFVEIQKNASIGQNCKISSHTFICEGVTIEDDVFIGHGVTFINDILSARHHRRRAAADRGRLESGDHAGGARRFHRIGRDHSLQGCHRRERHGRRGQRGDQRRSG